MEVKEEKNNIFCIFDKDQEELDIKIIQIFESYLERNNLENT